VYFDSLGAYGIADMFASLGMFVFLKEKVSWYRDLVGKFYANMQWSRKKLEIYCLVDGTNFVLTPSFIEKVFHLPNSGVEFFGRSFDTHGWNVDEARKLLLGKRYDPSVDMNTKLNASTLTPECRIMAKIIMHKVLLQGGHFDEIKSDAILLLYALKKNITENLAHAFVRNLMGGKSNIGYGIDQNIQENED